MRYKQLDKRLSAVAELVREGADICDIGTDHAYLPCFLARVGLYGRIYASDLNDGPLVFARATLTKQGLCEGTDVALLKSDGLAGVPVCDDIIIAGMGGELIADILANMPAAFRERGADLRFILQPMSKAQHLRTFLCENGFEIISEQSVNEGQRTFTIIYARLEGKPHDNSTN
ncbi:MAG: class I SAM-dependent methyltransferase [Oscillospiraceae bacterium]|nr:class I SAM-dependent methyltransferase [Oscillospiraceae bacterium]